MTGEFNFIVRGYELDSFGHVNNAIYLNYLEQARWEMLRDYKILDYLKDKNLFLVVIEVTIRYILEARIFDSLCVRSKAYWKFPYVIFKQDIFNNGNNRKTLKANVSALLVDEKRSPHDFPQFVIGEHGEKNLLFEKN